ncbi:MAG: hypothetical protein KFF73_14480, partial [Cyclobacteriaceae bacterium]|nr:hypothetical protein [Cyclobacteriaceae bacterium]
MMERKFTRHPGGKRGVNISAEKYRIVRDTLIAILKENPQITYREMNKMAIDRLKGNFEGSISWYVVTVKLDMEANGIIERIQGTRPHQLKL